DPSSLAQKVLANYNTWTSEQQVELQQMLGQQNQLLSALDLMTCIRSCKDATVLQRVEEALKKFNTLYANACQSEKSGSADLDELLALYVSNEQKFTAVQKQIMAAIMVPAQPQHHHLTSTSDAIIVSGIVHGDPKDVSLIRLKKTIQYCITAYRAPPEAPSFSPVPSYPTHLYHGALNFSK